MQRSTPRIITALALCLFMLAALVAGPVAYAAEPVGPDGSQGIEGVTALGDVRGVVFNDLNGNTTREGGSQVFLA